MQSKEELINLLREMATNVTGASKHLWSQAVSYTYYKALTGVVFGSVMLPIILLISIKLFRSLEEYERKELYNKVVFIVVTVLVCIFFVFLPIACELGAFLVPEGYLIKSLIQRN